MGSTNYAGHPISHGGNASSIRNEQACFFLHPAETIVHLEAEVQLDKKQEKNSAHLYSLRFTTNNGRQSAWFGRASKVGVGKKSTLLSLKAPVNNSHVVAIHGFGTEANTTWAIHGLGVYWGYGGGAGVWAPIKSCVGCGSWSFEFDYGRTKLIQQKHRLLAHGPCQ